jgi:hypothetical protein
MPVFTGNAPVQPLTTRAFQQGLFAERSGGIFRWLETAPIAAISETSRYGEAWEGVHNLILQPQIQPLAKWIQSAEPSLQFLGNASEKEYSKVQSPHAGAPVLHVPKKDDWSGAWPHGPTAGWHLDTNRTQLAAAWEAVRHIEPAVQPARIAIVDTHFDTNNPSLKGIHFSEIHHMTNHSGVFGGKQHGTGTLSILAGQEVKVQRKANAPPEIVHGANPDAEIVAIEGASGVAHVFSTRSISEGLSIAAESEVDVVSISMGGWPSSAVRDAANKCYDRGTAIFAASGDYFSWPFIPITTPSFVVYPAAYECCDAVVGITAKQRSYVLAPSLFGWICHLSDWSARGNAGPSWLMDRAVSAYSPNIVWANMDSTTDISLNGSGTSASTPQAAGAASLWYEKYRAQVNAIAGPEPWKKTELILQSVVNHAVLPGHADPSDAIDENLGHGVLKANTALAYGPDAALLPPQPRHGKPSLNWIAILLSMGYPRETRIAALDSTFIPETALEKSQAVLRESIEAVITNKLAAMSKSTTNVAASSATNSASLSSLTDVFVATLNLEAEQKFARTKDDALLLAWYQRTPSGPELLTQFSTQFTTRQARNLLHDLTSHDCSPTLRNVVKDATAKATRR